MGLGALPLNYENTPHLDARSSPSPTAEGGEGWGEEGRFSWNSPLPTRASHGEGEDLRSRRYLIRRHWPLAGNFRFNASTLQRFNAQTNDRPFRHHRPPDRGH